ncbi:MAG: HNH endonuclease [Bacteroidota bacterium]|nr:HNH endonuclease [Bacteroidota bacterium]
MIININNKYSTIIDDDIWPLISNGSLFVQDGRCGKKYVYIRNNGEKVALHRIIHKTPDGMMTDHINGNTFDNRRENLRTVTNQQNQFNRQLRIDNKSGYTGVFWNKQRGKWRASIKVNYKTKHIGYFLDKNEAYKAYLQEKEKITLNLSGKI